MASTFPGSVDVFTTKVDGVTDVLAEHVNHLQDAAVAIESEIGATAKGSKADLSERLDVSMNADGTLDLSATTLPNNSVGSAQITDGTVGANELASNAVTTAKILNAAVTGAKIGSLEVATGNIADGAVNANKLSSDSVQSAKIVDGAVLTAKLADDAVDSAKLKDDAVTDANRAVTTDHIRDANITQVKLAPNTLNGTVAANVADNAVIGGIPVVHPIVVPDGATGDIDVTLTHKTRITEVTVVKTSTLGGIGDAITVKNGATAITNAMDINVADKTVVRPTTMDDAAHEIAASGILRVTRTAGGIGNVACIVYVHGYRVA